MGELIIEEQDYSVLKASYLLEQNSVPTIVLQPLSILNIWYFFSPIHSLANSGVCETLLILQSHYTRSENCFHALFILAL